MLLVAKPAGPTSHDVVDVVRRVLDTRRVGHLGTLDPFAEGLLVLVVGRATRLAPFAGTWDKAYDGVMCLGVTTDTDDSTGRIVASSDAWGTLDRPAVAAALTAFQGTSEQRPPAYSAVKVAGERSHRRARRGEPVAPAARRVEVGELTLVAWTPPDIRFRATVSAGTYVRSLARDVGAALGCGGHLTELRRTRVGPFRLEDAVDAQAVTPADVREVATLVAGLARRDLSIAEREAVVHGRPIRAEPGTGDGGRVALFHDGQLVAVGTVEGEVVKPRVVVVAS